MRVTTAKVPDWAPDGAPAVQRPVLVELDIPVFYAGSGHLAASSRIFCGEAYASAVLAIVERLCNGWGFGIAHLGVYNPRHARKKDGTPIRPRRWSNHAYGEAMDWAGVVTREGEWLGIGAMRRGCPSKLDNIVTACRGAIKAAGRKPEIVDEGPWIHLGIWPK